MARPGNGTVGVDSWSISYCKLVLDCASRDSATVEGVVNNGAWRQI